MENEFVTTGLGTEAAFDHGAAIARIARDPKWFLENFTKIRGKKPGELIPFILNTPQVAFLNEVMSHNMVMVLKARQLGLCLSGDTLVKMADGSFKNIESIDVGEKVWGIRGPAKVVKTWKRRTDDRMYLIESEPKGTLSCFFATENHEVYVKKPGDDEASWVRTIDMRVGDLVARRPGKSKPMSWSLVTRKIQVATPEWVYDLTLEDGAGEAFETAGGIVHNSTISVGYLFWVALTQEGSSCQLIGYSAALASELLDKVNVFIESLPPSLRPTIKNRSKSEIVFAKMKSKIQVIASDRAGRGYTPSHVLLTELPFVDRAEEKLTAILGGLPPGTGKLILESSPGPIGDTFHNLWTDPDNGYRKLEFSWYWGYTEDEMNVKRAQMRSLTGSDDKFDQEFCLEFGVTGRPYFDPKMIRRLRKHQLEIGDEVSMGKDDRGDDIIWKVCEMNGLRRYRPPEKGMQYVLSADVAMGVTGGDYSVATIFCKNTGEEVAFYRGNMTQDKFGEKIVEWATEYNMALLIPESNNVGVATLQKVKELMYPSIYTRPARYDSMDSANSDRIGWLTSSRTREMMLSEFRAACDDGSLIIHSKEIFNEMTTFVVDDLNRPAALSGKHDDCVFSASIGWQGMKSVWIGTVSQLNYESYGLHAL